MVRETGGLKDTVEPYNEFEHTGTGFCFHNYNAHEMLYMVRYACKIFYQEPDEWRSIIARGMALDYSWGASSEKYAMLYDVLCAKAEEEKKADIARAKEQKRLEQERLDAELLARIRLEKTMTSRKKKKKYSEKIPIFFTRNMGIFLHHKRVQRLQKGTT
jgi:starch synthase